MVRKFRYSDKAAKISVKNLPLCFDRIDVNFHVKKSLEIFDKKSDPKRKGGGKCPASCQLGLIGEGSYLPF